MANRNALTSIKILLVQKGIKQSELASHLGISTVWMSRLLSGKAEMKLDMFLEIAAWLDVSASSLLGNEEDMAHNAA